MDKKYKILVVLCPGSPNGACLFEDQPKNDNMYLGGNIRMRSAAKIAPDCHLIIVIGGDEKKITGMEKYLIRNGISDNKIVKLESNPDTNGNLNALRKIFEKFPELNKCEVKILSNKYHCDRVEAMAKTIFPNEISLEFVSAEDSLKEEAEIIEKIYEGQMMARKSSEEQGVKDWEKGTYRDQKIDSWQFKSMIRDLDKLEAFLSRIKTKKV